MTQKYKKIIAGGLITFSLLSGSTAVYNSGYADNIIRVIAASLGYGACGYGQGGYGNNQCASSPIGDPVATTINPLTATAGGPAPTILLTGSTLPNGTIATFTPAGSATTITGTIQGGNFVPDAGQTLSPNITTGPATGVIKSAGAPDVNIPTNFSLTVASSSSSSVTTSAVSSSVVSSSSTTNSSTSSITSTSVSSSISSLTSSSVSRSSISPVPTTSLNLKVNLSGNYDATTGLMKTQLNTAGLIPTSQPYNVAPFNYTGTETATGIASDIVDWVLIEVKDSTGTATIQKKAALLKSNGTVVDSTSGATSLTLSNVTTSGQYKVIVRHRNHLAIATDTSVTLTLGIASNLDLTGNVNVKGANQLTVNTAVTVYGMRQANISGDNAINALDRTLSRGQAAGSNIYVPADVNLDGITNALDRTLTRLATPAVENL